MWLQAELCELSHLLQYRLAVSGVRVKAWTLPALTRLVPTLVLSRPTKKDKLRVKEWSHQQFKEKKKEVQGPQVQLQSHGWRLRLKRVYITKQCGQGAPPMPRPLAPVFRQPDRLSEPYESEISFAGDKLRLWLPPDSSSV